MIALWLVGCAYRVVLTSSIPAQVTLPSGRIVTTPEEVTLRWAPFGHQRVRVEARDHRPLEVDLRRSEIRLHHYVRDTLGRPATLLGAPRGEVHFLLIEEHGPAGTWSAGEVP
ncbi:MAG TPA: hypothetical protein ENK18_23565 [Deltaproteobacteria bacterium]|nr:hypothetical protein [Deltaproteobacteria bacterium]